jgi:hypothetical protein
MAVSAVAGTAAIAASMKIQVSFVTAILLRRCTMSDVRITALVGVDAISRSDPGKTRFVSKATIPG